MPGQLLPCPALLAELLRPEAGTLQLVSPPYALQLQAECCCWFAVLLCTHLECHANASLQTEHVTLHAAELHPCNSSIKGRKHT